MPADPGSGLDAQAALAERFAAELIAQADTGVDAGERSAAVARLTELGYLEIENSADLDGWLENGGPTPDVLTSALAAFRRECPVVTRQDAVAVSSGATAVHSVETPLPDPVELDLLARLVSFDGAAPELAPRLPTEGNTNLYSRSLHYRLQALGLFNHPVAAPLGPQTSAALTCLAPLVGADPGSDSVCDLLGDLARLLRSLVAHRGGRPVVYATTGELSSEERRLDTRLRTGHGWFDFRRDEARAQAAGWFQEPANGLILRVLKVLLWTYGFTGPGGYAATARPWRDEDVAGLLAAIRYHDVPVENGQVLARVGRAAGRQLVAVDVEDLVEAVFTPFSEAAASAAPDEVAAAIEAGEGPHRAAEGCEARGFLAQVKEAVGGGLRWLAGFAKRLYGGVRNVVVSAVHAVKTFVKEGVTGLAVFVRERAGPALNAVRVWLRRIRDGARIFARALVHVVHFVLRRPVTDTDPVTGAGVETRFDLDADVVRVIDRRVPSALIEAHARRCVDLARGSRLLLVIAARVLGEVALLVTGAGLAWLRFAYKVGVIVHRVIGDWDLIERLAIEPVRS